MPSKQTKKKIILEASVGSMAPSRDLNTPVSELRRDLVTGDWILIAKQRGKRPHAFIAGDDKEIELPTSQCPFEDPQKSGNAPPVLLYKNAEGTDWEVQVIPNKYPAFAQQGECLVPQMRGPYEVIDGKGFHEVIITRDHEKHWAFFSREEATNVVRAYQERYQKLKDDECVTYISIFHNHKRAAGASLAHPHSQLIAIPVVPADVRRSLEGSRNYFHKNGRCVHCETINFEVQEKSRIVFENERFIAFCPFISRTAFEIRLFPKNHQEDFGSLSPEHYSDLADGLREPLKMLNGTLQNPAYNFFLHTAPLDGVEYQHYHWHFEIVPKTAIAAGFELGTGIEISTLEPEQAAEFLREQ
ncbi:MAG: galactose-1-phosphate uridylyltransferase [Candidatus Spechtbacteria bacterium]|nr:galactose-1-phosphate uridylyltransferase [Candidatus Spechtbacteria bacterium]